MHSTEQQGHGSIESTGPQQTPAGLFPANDGLVQKLMQHGFGRDAQHLGGMRQPPDTSDQSSSDQLLLLFELPRAILGTGPHAPGATNVEIGSLVTDRRATRVLGLEVEELVAMLPRLRFCL